MGWQGGLKLGGEPPSAAAPMAPVTSKPGTVDVLWQGPGGDL